MVHHNFDQYGTISAHQLKEVIENEQIMISKYDILARAKEDNGDIAAAGYYRQIAAVHQDIKERVEQSWESQERAELGRVGK